MQVQCQYTLKWNFVKTEFESLKTQSEDWYFFSAVYRTSKLVG